MANVRDILGIQFVRVLQIEMERLDYDESISQTNLDTLTMTGINESTRDEVVDFVRTWSDKTGVPACRFLLWLDLSAGKFHDWKQRATTGSRRTKKNASAPTLDPSRWRATADSPL